jgi:hypothetical protein
MNNNNNDDYIKLSRSPRNDDYIKWLERVRETGASLRQDKLAEENLILSQNVYDLQKQLQEAHKRIKELIDRSIVSM